MQDDERVRFLRQTGRGVGWLFSHKHYEIEAAKPDADQQLRAFFDREPLPDFYVVVTTALDLMPPSPQKDAIENALGAGKFRGRQLADRRRDFAEALDVSERTVLRYEAEGAEALLHVMFAVLKAGAGDPSLADLQATVAELQATVKRLERQLGEASQSAG